MFQIVQFCFHHLEDSNFLVTVPHCGPQLLPKYIFLYLLNNPVGSRSSLSHIQLKD